MKKRLLLVDDEAGIRLTLPAILEGEGFDVSVAASVPEAIQAIQGGRFDILLSDLNIGQPGDGFTVVSAMRRIQPHAATFIMTGYPDFESALIAVRNQVDDYFIKSADINLLVEKLKERASAPSRFERLPSVKRISTIIRENREEITQRWLARNVSNPELSAVKMSEQQRIDQIPEFLLQIADCVECHPDQLSEVIVQAARKHGDSRFGNGYSIPMLLVEASILEKTIAEVVQEHLLSIDISTLVSDMQQLSQSINCAVEISIRAFLQKEPAQAA
ncbi:MAG TPA: response regulator [Terriglobales bacterium]|nr:response regulator [Terriglobales bacterium]